MAEKHGFWWHVGNLMTGGTFDHYEVLLRLAHLSTQRATDQYDELVRTLPELTVIRKRRTAREMAERKRGIKQEKEVTS